MAEWSGAVSSDSEVSSLISHSSRTLMEGADVIVHFLNSRHQGHSTTHCAHLRFRSCRVAACTRQCTDVKWTGETHHGPLVRQILSFFTSCKRLHHDGKKTNYLKDLKSCFARCGHHVLLRSHVPARKSSSKTKGGSCMQDAAFLCSSERAPSVAG